MTNDEARELATIANEAADQTAAIVRKVAEQRAAIVQRMAEEMAAIVHRADEERAAIVQKVADKARQLAKAHTSRTPTAEGKKYLTEFEHRWHARDQEGDTSDQESDSSGDQERDASNQEDDAIAGTGDFRNAASSSSKFPSAYPLNPYLFAKEKDLVASRNEILTTLRRFFNVMYARRKIDANVANSLAQVHLSMWSTQTRPRRR